MRISGRSNVHRMAETLLLHTLMLTSRWEGLFLTPTASRQNFLRSTSVARGGSSGPRLAPLSFVFAVAAVQRGQQGQRWRAYRGQGRAQAGRQEGMNWAAGQVGPTMRDHRELKEH